MKFDARDSRQFVVNILPNLVFGLFILFLWLIIVGPAQVFGEEESLCKITGSIIFEETGEPLPGVSVMLQGTTYGAATNLDGQFKIDHIPAGDYELVITTVGFAKTTIKDVHVVLGQIVHINVPLKSDAIAVKDVVVEAKRLENTEASLLKDRQKSNSVSDAISSEEISRGGSGNAAEAMSHVTGASVVGGKYVLIRGLGERYSTTQLNGAELPSADPDKKSFQMDLLPSNLLDNIVTIKSFTPDEPGNFSGGIVDIGTKNYPESFTFRVSTSMATVSGTTHNSNFLGYSGGGRDWTGMDDGSREIPDMAKNTRIPDITETLTDSSKAHLLDRLSKSFNSVMAPRPQAAPINRNFAISIGNQVSLLGRKLGYLGSMSYNRSCSFYRNGEFAKWRLQGAYSRTDSLDPADTKLTDSQGSSEAIWGGLAMLSYSLHPRHQISANFLYTQSGENIARYMTGDDRVDLSEGQLLETRVLKYTQRNLKSFQLNGSHDLYKLAGLRFDWLGAYSKNTQDEPDLRFFSNSYEIDGSDTVYGVGQTSGFTYPQRLWRNLSEDNSSFDIKISKPFRQWSGLSGNFRIGGSFSKKNRTYRERVFEYDNSNQGRYGYHGDPNLYFSDAYVGLMDSSYGFYRFANYIVDRTQPISNYDGKQKISATFAMIELPLTSKIRFIGGTRLEETKIDCVTQDTTQYKGKLRNSDLLSSGSLIYQLFKDMNLRLAYGKTLARPTFRELVPYATFDFVGDWILIGNPKLKRTLIDNYDLRLEWFPRPGEIFAASGFYKNFTNPIERSIINTNGEVQYQNVNRGQVYGVEFELRQKLDRLNSHLSNFSVGGNVSFDNSKVRISDKEFVTIRAQDSTASHYRTLWGQSPYIVTLDLVRTGTSAKIKYNVSGKRLSTVTIGATPDIFEFPQPSLDFGLSQRLLYGMRLKFSAQNLLDSSYRLIQTFKGKNFIAAKYDTGQSFSMSIIYDIG